MNLMIALSDLPVAILITVLALKPNRKFDYSLIFRAYLAEVTIHVYNW